MTTERVQSSGLKSSVEKCNRVVPLLVEGHRQIVVLRKQLVNSALREALECLPVEAVEFRGSFESPLSTLLSLPQSRQRTGIKTQLHSQTKDLKGYCKWNVFKQRLVVVCDFLTWYARSGV